MNTKKMKEKKEFVNLLFKICLDLGVENSQMEVENFLAEEAK